MYFGRPTGLGLAALCPELTPQANLLFEAVQDHLNIIEGPLSQAIRDDQPAVSDTADALGDLRIFLLADVADKLGLVLPVFEECDCD